jgi:hypothetical protein
MSDYSDTLHDDQKMLFAFGTLDPSIAYLPHCICSLAEDEIIIILDVVKAKGGIWGELPQFDENGNYFTPPWEDDLKTFSLWETPANQSIVLKGISNFAEFTKMIIDTKTPLEVLAKTYSYNFEGKTFPVFLDQVRLWINDLKWALIALEGDNDYDLFVVREDLAVWAEEVLKKFLARGYKAFKLQAGQDRFYWTEPKD